MRTERIPNPYRPADRGEDMKVLGAYGFESCELSLAFVYRKIPVYKALQPRGRTPDGRDKWSYYAVLHHKDGHEVLKGLSQAGIKAQIGRCMNGLTPHDCNVCVYWRNADPMQRDGYCSLTISPELTGFFGCPRFEVRI